MVKGSPPVGWWSGFAVTGNVFDISGTYVRKLGVVTIRVVINCTQQRICIEGEIGEKLLSHL